MKRVAIFCILLIISVFAQIFENVSAESFGALKYEIGTDHVNYSRPSVLHCYLHITNISDREVSFQTPSPDLCYFRVTKGHYEVDLFPMAVLPVIGDWFLTPGESVADTQMWDISPAIWDTTYRLWGVLNIATSWEPFPKDSHYVSFSIGITSVNENTSERFSSWFMPSPLGGTIRLPFDGQYELFNISGRIVETFQGSGTFETQDIDPGIYFLRHRESQTTRKVVILR